MRQRELDARVAKANDKAQEKARRVAEHQAAQETRRAQAEATRARLVQTRQELEEERQIAAALAALPPSDRTGQTASAEGFLRLVSTTAIKLRDQLPPPFWPSLHFLAHATTDEQPALMGFIDQWRRLFVEAWEAAAAQTDAAQKRAHLYSVLARGHVSLYEAGLPLCGRPQAEFGPAFCRLQHAVRDAWVVLNEPPPPPLPAEDGPDLSTEERGVVRHIGGWALRCELAHSYSHGERALVSCLQQCVSVDEPNACVDAAQLYIESRELYGGLLRITNEMAWVFEKVELELHASLTLQRLLDEGENVLQASSVRVNTSMTVTNLFRELWPESPPAHVETLRKRLINRYMHSRAKAFKREVMHRIEEHKQSVSRNTSPPFPKG